MNNKRQNVNIMERTAKVDERKCRDLTWYSTESSVSLRNVEGRWSLGDSPLVPYDVGGGSLEVIMGADAAGGRAAASKSDMVE